jgi:hypothetical protein
MKHSSLIYYIIERKINMTLKEYYKNRLQEGILSNKLRRTLGAVGLASGLFAGGGAAVGVAAPYIRDAKTTFHKAIGNPVGGEEVSRARAEAANKVGLVGSTVPAGTRALYGAGLGVGLLAAGSAAEGLKGTIKGRRK